MNQRTSLIKSISIENESSWQNRVFLTFDLDWCSDGVFSFTLDLLEKHNVAATFFVTHSTPLLQRARENPNFELGIHPNFDFLLFGDFRYGKNINEVIEYYLRIVPEAVSVRSHALTRSSRILRAFEEHGLIYDCNLLLPIDFEPRPFYHWGSRIICAPHFFEDDVECLSSWFNRDRFRQNNRTDFLQVYNFHPIHIFLNSVRLDQYEAARPYFLEEDILAKYVNHSEFGTRDFLIELLMSLQQVEL